MMQQAVTGRDSTADIIIHGNTVAGQAWQKKNRTFSHTEYLQTCAVWGYGCKSALRVYGHV